MTKRINLNNPEYKPFYMLEKACEILGVKNYTELARVLGLNRNYFYHIGKRRQGIGPAIFLALHDASGLPANHFRKLAGMEEVPCKK